MTSLTAFSRSLLLFRFRIWLARALGHVCGAHHSCARDTGGRLSEGRRHALEFEGSSCLLFPARCPSKSVGRSDVDAEFDCKFSEAATLLLTV